MNIDDTNQAYDDDDDVDDADDDNDNVKDTNAHGNGKNKRRRNMKPQDRVRNSEMQLSSDSMLRQNRALSVLPPRSHSECGDLV